jgi:hypothetical protein
MGQNGRTVIRMFPSNMMKTSAPDCMPQRAQDFGASSGASFSQIICGAAKL